MSLVTPKQLLSSFYESNKTFLLENYPGLTCLRLENELKSFLQLNANEIGADLNSIFLPSKENHIQEFIDLLLKGLPLEQIVGRAYFYKSEFYINENVLIPRSETEILVERSVDFIKSYFKNKVSVCDIGTGSGAIILSVMSELSNIEVNAVACDISQEALDVANINYFRNFYQIDKNSQLEFVLSDRFNSIERDFDIILSNPPYIKESLDREKVHGQVHEHEPHLALYLKDMQYDEWFNDFFKQVDHHLNSGGLFFMEGHEDHLEQQKEAFKKVVEIEKYHNIELIKDYTGRTRFLWATKKN